MEQTERKHHAIQSLFTAALFGMFALCCTLVLIFGARIYQGIVSSGENNAEIRTSLSYVAEKIHQNDTLNGIRLEAIGETPALSLSNIYSGTEYTTYIYFWDGQLKEQTLRTGSAPDKKTGQIIAELKDFNINQINDTLYRFTACSEDGKEKAIYVNTKSQ